MVIELRTPTWDDMEYIRWLWGDEETMEPVGGPIQLTDEQALEWFQRVVDPGSPTGLYQLIFNEDQRPVGEVSFHHFDPKTKTAMFNLKIAKAERGKGYARAAMRAFLNAYFTAFGGHIMLDDVALDNLLGQEVLLQFGFVHDPSVENVYRMQMTRDRYNYLYREWKRE